jgi:hypothetical protein
MSYRRRFLIGAGDGSEGTALQALRVRVPEIAASLAGNLSLPRRPDGRGTGVASDPEVVPVTSRTNRDVAVGWWNHVLRGFAGRWHYELTTSSGWLLFSALQQHVHALREKCYSKVRLELDVTPFLR